MEDGGYRESQSGCTRTGRCSLTGLVLMVPLVSGALMAQPADGSIDLFAGNPPRLAQQPAVSIVYALLSKEKMSQSNYLI